MRVYGVAQDDALVLGAVVRKRSLKVINLVAGETLTEIDVFLDALEVLHQRRSRHRERRGLLRGTMLLVWSQMLFWPFWLLTLLTFLLLRLLLTQSLLRRLSVLLNLHLHLLLRFHKVVPGC